VLSACIIGGKLPRISRGSSVNDYRLAASTLVPYLRAAADVGIDPARALSSVNLTMDAVEAPQARLAFQDCMNVLRCLIALSRNDSLGLYSAKYVDIGSFDINGYISVNCSTPLEAITLTADYYGILSDQRVLYDSEGSKHVTSQWRFTERMDVADRNFADSLLATYVRFGRMNLRLHEGVVLVTFRHSAPKDAETLRLYEEMFNCPLLFDQQQYSVVFDRAVLRNTRIPQADRSLRDVLIAHAAARIRDIRTTPPFTHQVKSLIRGMFQDGAPTRESVADRMHLGSRTLQRQLLTEGSSYKSVFNEVRRELALDYLKDRTLSLDDVAEKLGFSETRSLHRSFKQWTGDTPGDYREQLARLGCNV